MKLCSRLLMLYCRNSREKRKIWVYGPDLGELRDDARPWMMAHWKVHGRLSTRVNWTFFAIYYGSGVMRRNVYSSRLFSHAGGRPLCTQILPGQGRLRHPYLAPEDKRHWATGWWRLHPSAFPHLDTIPDCEGQTDGQTDGWICRSIYIACKAMLCETL